MTNEEKERARQFVIDELVKTEAFMTQYPVSLTPAEYVDRLNASTGGRLSSADRGALVNDLQAGARTRAQAFRKVYGL